MQKESEGDANLEAKFMSHNAAIFRREKKIVGLEFSLFLGLKHYELIAFHSHDVCVNSFPRGCHALASVKFFYSPESKTLAFICHQRYDEHAVH